MQTGTDPNSYDMRFSLSFFSVLFITLVQQQTIPAFFDDKKDVRIRLASNVYQCSVSSRQQGFTAGGCIK